ncbi:MAG: D-alanyl-D-alanine carboxypeptidase/D-alanyl-D-alanine-endopeptidase [Planctomycetota bacterium]
MPATTARRFPLAVLSALILVALVASPAQAQRNLQARLDQVMSGAQIGEAVVGYAVVDIGSRRQIAGYQADRLFIPASNQKLLTAGAALLTLGPEYTFTTALLAQPATNPGDPDRLILVGSGDPALGDPVILGLGDPPLSPAEVIDHLAAAGHVALPAATELVIDDRVFDRETVHPSWPSNQLQFWYCAEVAGVNFHTNTLDVYLRAGGAGSRATVETVVPDAQWVQFNNRTRSARRGDQTAGITKPPTTPWRHTLAGNVVNRVKITVSVHDPAEFTGRLLAQSIGAIEGSETPSVRLAQPGESFEGARKIAAIHTGLDKILDRVLVNSHNLYAEAVFKHLDHRISGQPGSWSSGAAQMRAIIAEHMGPDAAASVRISDGSGMSRDNRLTPAFLADWVAAMVSKPDTARAFLDAMPSVGEGTLRNRFQGLDIDSDVYAKSGYLRGVYTLSGVVRAGSRGLAFSILVNDGSPNSRVHPKRLHELLIDEMDDWLLREQAAPLGG